MWKYISTRQERHQPTYNDTIEEIKFDHNNKNICFIDIGASINLKKSYDEYNQSPLSILKISSNNKPEVISKNKIFFKYQYNINNIIFDYLDKKKYLQ